MNPNKALWQKGDFTRTAESMRESGEALIERLGISNGLKSEMKTNFGHQFQEFRVRRISLITGKLVEMPILMTKRHFLMAHQAFKNRTGDRKLIPYLTESEYRFLFEGISPKQTYIAKSFAPRAPDAVWLAPRSREPARP